MKIFVDLDGVMTDFSKQLCDLLGKPLDRDFDFGNDPKVWKKIDEAGEDFWADMEWMPGGRRLWDELKKYNPTILTAPSRHKSSIEGKKKWLKENLPGVPFIIEEDKDKYAAPDSILVDDREKNINAWEEAEGIGILHKETPKTIEKLNKVVSDMSNKKKACISHVLRQAASFVESGKSWEDFLKFQEKHQKNPYMVKEYQPQMTKKKHVSPFFFSGVSPHSKSRMYGTLEKLFKNLNRQIGGVNQEAKNNLRHLITSLEDAERAKISSPEEKEKMLKEILNKARNVFPLSHSESDLNSEIAEYIKGVLGGAPPQELRRLSNKIAPSRGYLKGDPFKPETRSERVYIASEKLKDIISTLFELVK